jgi:hypothetical protein
MMHACLTAVFGTRQHWQSGTRSPIRKRELQRTPLEVKKIQPERVILEFVIHIEVTVYICTWASQSVVYIFRMPS